MCYVKGGAPQKNNATVFPQLEDQMSPQHRQTERLFTTNSPQPHHTEHMLSCWWTGGWGGGTLHWKKKSPSLLSHYPCCFPSHRGQRIAMFAALLASASYDCNESGRGLGAAESASCPPPPPPLHPGKEWMVGIGAGVWQEVNTACRCGMPALLSQ